MTLFGFLGTIIICGTLIALPVILHKYPLSIRIKKHIIGETVPTDTTEKVDNAAIEESLNDYHKTQQEQGMDSLISAVNDLMGIQITKEDDVNGKA